MVTEGRTTTPNRTFWERLLADGCPVPGDLPLDELTVELGRLLGSPDGHERDDIAHTMLTAWVGRGVYDDLLIGLGDGMSTGMRRGLGEQATDTVFRRSFSALILAEIVARDSEAELLHPDVVLRWGDRALGWFVRERDLRGFVPGKGWAHAVAHGADLLLALALSRHLGTDELGVLLDTVADRLLTPTTHRFVHGEDDRLAYATMGVLHRGALDMDVLRPWVERIATGWQHTADSEERRAVPFNTSGYLRTLHLQLQLGVRSLVGERAARHFQRSIDIRIELLGAIAKALRTSHPVYRPGPT